MVTRMKFRDRCAQRREFAVELDKNREKRGDANQLARLETNGHGHCKEAKKLCDLLSKVQPAAKEETCPEK